MSFGPQDLEDWAQLEAVYAIERLVCLRLGLASLNLDSGLPAKC